MHIKTTSINFVVNTIKAVINYIVFINYSIRVIGNIAIHIAIVVDYIVLINFIIAIIAINIANIPILIIMFICFICFIHFIFIFIFSCLLWYQMIILLVVLRKILYLIFLNLHL